jgi:hypothetical protein
VLSSKNTSIFSKFGQISKLFSPHTHHHTTPHHTTQNISSKKTFTL